MAQITFYPLGNADSSLIEFADERFMLIDYCSREEHDIDLSEELKNKLNQKKRDYFDVVAFTHRDSDHVDNAEDFFWLEHADKYQDDDRIKINEMWVPACFVLETGLEGSARILRQEARYRLKEGKNIKVFGNPGSLDDWLEENDISPNEREDLIVSAGNCADWFVTAENGQAELFIHSPYKFMMEDNEEVDQNNASLVFHATFFEGEKAVKAFFGGDAEHETWDYLIYKTHQKKRFERLAWDIFHVSHHCSYTALSEEKGKDKTEPTKNIKWLFEEQGQDECIMVSPSDIIPNEDNKQPPHMQAKAFYKDIEDQKDGRFIVTMEHPKEEAPKPLVIVIDKNGHDIDSDDVKEQNEGGYTKREGTSKPQGGRFA